MEKMPSMGYLACLFVMSGLLVFRFPLWVSSATLTVLLIYRLIKKISIGELYLLSSAIIYSIYFIYIDFGGVLLYPISDLTIDIVKGQVGLLQVLCVAIAFLYSLFYQRVDCIFRVL